MSIMVAFDGSRAAKEALNLATKRAGTFEEEIEVVQASEKGAELNFSDINKLEKNLDEEIQTLMNDENIRFKTTFLVSSQTAGEQIARHLKIRKSSEICMGIERRSKVGKLLFGSTAQYLILNAPCPVVTTR